MYSFRIAFALSFFCTGVQCGSVFVFSVFRAVHTDRKVSGGERRKRDTTDLATQDEQEQYKKRGKCVRDKPRKITIYLIMMVSCHFFAHTISMYRKLSQRKIDKYPIIDLKFEGLEMMHFSYQVD